MRKRHNNTHVLQVGNQLFRKQGYHTTGTEEILEKADYPRSSFYHHFKSKEGFAIKGVELYGESIRENLENILNNKSVDSPLKRLKNYFYVITAYHEKQNNDDCCLVQRLSIEGSIHDNDLHRAAYDQFKKWVKIAEPTIKAARDCGELRIDLDIPQTSEFLFTMIYGATTVGRISKDPKELEKKMNLAFRLIQKI